VNQFLAILLLVVVGCATSNTSATHVHNQSSYVVPKVPVFLQGTKMACWITCAAMLKSWHGGVLIAPNELAAKLGEPWLTLFQTDAGLSRERYIDFAGAMGLRYEWPANRMPDGYTQLLRDHGPLWIASGLSSHARILYGVVQRHGKTVMLFNDPATGTKREQSFEEFFPEFEKEAVAIVGYRPELALPIQILHY